VDINQSKVDLINSKKSPIIDKEIEKYLMTKPLIFAAMTFAKSAYSDADYIIISTPAFDKVYMRDVYNRD